MSAAGEKYTSTSRYHAIRVQRFFLRAIIRHLARWRPMTDPQDGYTVIIGVASPLERIVHTNLKMLTRQRLGDLKEVILVCDRPKDQLATPLERELREAFPDLPLRFLYWTAFQRRLVDRLKFPWIDSWLSWSKGIAACRTRYALLHDLDAMLLRDDILEKRFEAITSGGDSYVGVKWYEGNGITQDDRLVVTFELMFDAQLVRGRFRPIDLFNHVRKLGGRRVEMDTFLHAQTLAGTTRCERVDGANMVHPSQLFCQFNDLRRRPGYEPPEMNNLPLIPYFLYLAGDADVLERHRRAFDQTDNSRVRFFDMTMDARHLSRAHVTWLRQQADRLESAIAGSMRPEVHAYLESIERFVERRDGAGRAVA